MTREQSIFISFLEQLAYEFEKDEQEMRDAQEMEHMLDNHEPHECKLCKSRQG
ncbi:MAG: hypothetical protein JWN86_3209 [Planctomycetota bacterium]|nr:hypothetical protein [Planctomycetota bacterium]